MASLFQKIRSTVGNIVRLGFSGPQLKNSSGVIEARNSTDSGYAKFRVDDPTGNNDCANKLYTDQLNDITNVAVERNSTTQFQVRGKDNTPKYLFIKDEKVDFSSAKSCNVSGGSVNNLLASDGTDSSSTPSASTKYNIYASNSSASYSPSTVRLCATAPTGDYLQSSGNGANWRFVGDIILNSSTQIGHGYDCARELSPYPAQWICWHRDSIVISGNAIVHYATTNQTFNYYGLQSTSAIGDTFEQSVFLDKGNYGFTIQSISVAAAGKGEWYLDNSLIATLDTSNPSPILYNNAQTFTNISVSNRGMHKLSFTCTGQGVLGSGYDIPLTRFWFSKFAVT